MKVKDLMTTELITVDSRKSIDYALRLMREYNIRRLPVVEGGRLLGMIVQHDIEIALRRPGVIPETPVDWVMTKELWTTTPEADLAEAIGELITHKISALPVLDGSSLVGLISEIDVLRMVREKLLDDDSV